MTSGATARLAPLGAVLLLALPARAQSPAESRPSGQPMAPAPAVAAPAPVPAPGAYPYPTPYGYPPGNGYPPPYAYPVPPGHPGYPPGYAAYPPQPPPPPVTTPDELPSGKWRVGGALVLIPQANLVYDLKYRGEPLDYYDRGVSTTAGVAVFTEYDVVSHLFVGLTLQFLPSIKWKPLPRPASASPEEMPPAPFGGRAREYDVLPQVGGHLNATARLRLLVYVAPGYSLFDASSLDTAIPIKHGNVHGFVLQMGGGLLYAIGQQGFLRIRGLYQRSSHKGQVESPTTGQTAEPNFFFSFFALEGAGGFWF